jgi:hypothetical protein
MHRATAESMHRSHGSHDGEGAWPLVTAMYVCLPGLVVVTAAGGTGRGRTRQLP